MADKILTEAFDKLKAIEESDDPFCIGAKADNKTNGYTELDEADFDADMKSGYPGDNDDDEESLEQYKDNYNKGYEEEPNARAEDRFFEMEDESGHNYRVSFQTDSGKDRAFIEVDGNTIATYTVGGAGAMDAYIKDPATVLDMLTAAMKAPDGTGL